MNDFTTEPDIQLYRTVSYRAFPAYDEPPPVTVHRGTRVPGHDGYLRYYTQNARAKARNLPFQFTHWDWLHCLEHFHFCCAACGCQALDLFNSRMLVPDHWIPIINPGCPGTLATNIIPLCHSRQRGAMGCNNLKFDKLPGVWLTGRYGKRKANQILKRIDDYFASV